MIRKEFHSKTDNQKIYYYVAEAKKPKMILHLVHGSLECALQHKPFINFLNKHNISVYAMDLRGHGQTGKDAHFGYFADENGAEKVILDVYQLNEIIKKDKKNKDLEIVFLGNSMGTFIIRVYLTQFHDVKRAILLGTCHSSPFLRNFLYQTSRRNSSTIKKARRYAKFLNSVTYNRFNIRFWREGKAAWVTRDRSKLSFMPQSGYGFPMLTYKGFFDMTVWLNKMTNKKLGELINKDTKLLLLNGKDDPVSNYGAEVKKAFNFYKKKLKLDTKWIQYPEMRHDILNDFGREKIYQDVLDFLLQSKENN